MTDNLCLICRGSSFEELLHFEEFPILFGALPAGLRGKVKKYPLSVAICNECSLVQQVNLLPTSILDEVYTSEYYSCPAPTGNNVGEKVTNEFISFFTANVPERKGRLLEVGCFDGYLLGELQNDGWDVYGCDPAGQTSIAIKNIGSDRIINDFFCKSTYTDKKFDVIIFRNLLEHLYDLHSFLDDVAAILQNDGCVFIEVPNIYKTFDTGGFGSFFHQHVSHFSIETLHSLLNKCGFTVEQYGESDVLHVKAKKIKGIINAKRVVVDMRSRRQAFLSKHRQIEAEIKRIFADPSHLKIAIFGASAGATAIVSTINQEQRSKIIGIFDNDLWKHGKFIGGVDVPISAPEKIEKEAFDVLIISSWMFSEEICAQLVKMGVDKDRIIPMAKVIL